MKRSRVYAGVGWVLGVGLAALGCSAPAEAPAWPKGAPVPSPRAPDPVPTPEVEEPTEATVKDADRVVARLRPGFRACYERGRRERGPRLAGRMMLVTRVRRDGTVKSTHVRDVRGLPPLVTDCVERQMRGAKFRPPGGSARVEVPVLFIRRD